MRMQRAGRALGGAEGAGDAGGRDSSAFEPGLHRSVYERAFGPLGDVGFDHGRVPAPWPQHSDMFDEHEHEEMLYRRQMALAAQDRARSVPLPTWLCRGSSARRSWGGARGTRPCRFTRARASPRACSRHFSRASPGACLRHLSLHADPDLTVQAPSRCASFTAQMGGGSKPYHRMPADYTMHPMHGCAFPTPCQRACVACADGTHTGSPHARLSALTLARARKSRGADSLLALGGHAGRTTRP